MHFRSWVPFPMAALLAQGAAQLKVLVFVSMLPGCRQEAPDVMALQASVENGNIPFDKFSVSEASACPQHLTP